MRRILNILNSSCQAKVLFFFDFSHCFVIKFEVKKYSSAAPTKVEKKLRTKLHSCTCVRRFDHVVAWLCENILRACKHL